MSSFLSSIIAPNGQDGTVLVHVPLQVNTPDEARQLAAQLSTCADIAEKAKDGDKPGGLRNLLKRP